MGAPSGAMHSFTVNCAPIVDGAGKTRGILVTFDDITEVEKRNAELQRMMSELEKTKDEVNRQNHELRFLATRDPLTGCLNRRAFFECFETAVAEARASGQPLACIMADIDHFKAINDGHGHATGDKVITAVADVLRAVLRGNDLIGRYGGEEFCVILPDVSRENAVVAADRIRRQIRAGLGAQVGSDLRVTISLGVAFLEDGAATPLELVNQADCALYAAKESGRNRVLCWGDTLVTRRGDAKDGTARLRTPSVTVEGTVRTRAIADGSPTLEIRHLRERLGELEGRSPDAIDNQFREGYDEITGLPGHVLFSDRVNQIFTAAKRAETAAAILCVGVQTFRRINTTLGLAVGNALLRAVGERIVAVVRGNDTVAWLAADGKAPVSRLGSDEFGVALGSLPSAESTTWIVKRLLERLAEPFQIGEHEIYVTAAIGIGLYPHDSENLDDLLQFSSAARHHAEDNPGPNRYVFFAREMNELSYQQISLDAEMRHAIDRGEFELHYQPKLDLRTGLITAVEALIRWHHPRRGLVSPMVFIPIAERTGFITEIGDWVLRTACLQAKQWLDDGLAVRMAVNLSAVQLRSETFVQGLVGILAEVGISAQNLELEVTETAVMADLEGAVAQLHELRRIGAHIAIDDFGTGYSSLSYVKHFAADTLKIDGSFVADIATDANDAALVAAIIAMAHRLGLHAVAEGVETDEQLDQLRKLQCDSAQGYLFSRPVPADGMLALLKSNNSLVPPAETDIRHRKTTAAPVQSKAKDTIGAGRRAYTP
jgi:diguanylate cyclase (GGDEF)-like protein